MLTKCYPLKISNYCEGCPFNYPDQVEELFCDSGYYSKDEWDIEAMKKALDKEL